MVHHLTPCTDLNINNAATPLQSWVRLKQPVEPSQGGVFPLKLSALVMGLWL